MRENSYLTMMEQLKIAPQPQKGLGPLEGHSYGEAAYDAEANLENDSTELYRRIVSGNKPAGLASDGAWLGNPWGFAEYGGSLEGRGENIMSKQVTKENQHTDSQEQVLQQQLTNQMKGLQPTYRRGNPANEARYQALRTEATQQSMLNKAATRLKLDIKEENNEELYERKQTELRPANM